MWEVMIQKEYFAEVLACLVFEEVGCWGLYRGIREPGAGGGGAGTSVVGREGCCVVGRLAGELIN